MASATCPGIRRVRVGMPARDCGPAKGSALVKRPAHVLGPAITVDLEYSRHFAAAGTGSKFLTLGGDNVGNRDLLARSITRIPGSTDLTVLSMAGHNIGDCTPRPGGFHPRVRSHHRRAAGDSNVPDPQHRSCDADVRRRCNRTRRRGCARSDLCRRQRHKESQTWTLCHRSRAGWLWLLDIRTARQSLAVTAVGRVIGQTSARRVSRPLREICSHWRTAGRRNVGLVARRNGTVAPDRHADIA